MRGKSIHRYVTRNETEQLLEFLAEESKKAEEPLNHAQLSREFIEKSGSFRTKDAVRRQIPIVLKKIYSTVNIHKETKLRMLFALSGQVNEEFLNELRKDAVVVVDQKQRITKYETNDGSLKLEGDHSLEARMKAALKTRKRSSGIPRDLQEEDEEDFEEGNKKVITHSARISKKPYLYDHSFSNEMDEELMDFDGHDIHAQLQSATRKRNTQTSESIKKLKKTTSHEAEVPEDDVIYEGPGEPSRPVQLPVKREPVEEQIVFLDDEELQEETKPETVGFFGNLNNCQFEEDVDFGVSPEDAVDSFSTALSTPSSMNVSQPSSDSTNITKFLELLRSLVGTLESPKLFWLHEKINTKIRELGDQNLTAPTKYIPFSLESVILFVTKNAASSYLEEDSTSLKEFLLIFRAAAYNLTSPEFVEFQKSLKEAINKIGNQNKRIPYKEIQCGLEYAIKLVLP